MQKQNCNLIINNLYLGNKKAIYSNEILYSLVVNVTSDVPFDNICKNNIRISIQDDPLEYNKLYNLIEENKILEQIHKHLINIENVLIHCHMGMQRSCAVVACYLIKYHNLEINEAIEFIKSKRSIAFFGNVNFIETLKLYK